MSGELSTRPGVGVERPSHGPGRQLGQKRKPQLRLGLGYRDEQTRGIVKTDYFIPRGDDRAVAKFMAQYGDRPRAVDIRLPGSLAGFLDIRHVAFAGGQSGEGGYLRAAGAQNFALTGSLGGPDVLTVFDKVETGDTDRRGKPATTLAVEEIPITGVLDPAAQGLGVYLQMVVSFGIPDVLGFGGLCQVSTRGKESIDTLWETAVDIYGQLGSYVFTLRPKLVLKRSSMLTPQGIRAELYVLDLYVPESMDEVYKRLERHHELVPARGVEAAALLYGEDSSEEEPQASAARPDTPVAPTADVSDDRSLSGESPSDSEEQSGEPASAAPSWFAAHAPETASSVVHDAGETVFPVGMYRGMTLHEIAESDEGRRYLKWAAKNFDDPAHLVVALEEFLQGLP